MASRRAIVVLLSSFSLLGYVLRMNISIASKFMMPALKLSEIQMGQIFSAFMLGYALFQVPWGVLGDRAGPRRTLTAAALVWGVATLLTGLVPGVLAPVGFFAFVSLLILRFLLGLGEAAAFPLAARSIASWLPASRRAFSYSIVILGGVIGMAFTGPFISWIMVRLGWRESFYVSSAAALLLAALWYRAANVPSQSGILAAAAFTPSAATEERRVSWLALLKERNIFLICASYFLDSYILFIFVFWFYLYLVEDRGFGVLRSGVYTSLPFVVAMFLVPVAGYLCDRLSARARLGTGRRTVAMTGLLLAAVFLVAGVRLSNPYHAIAGLSLSVGFLLCTEPAFWSSSIDIGGANAGAAGGIMNTAGNFGGVVSTALVPVIVKHFGWTFAFESASVLAVCAAFAWLFIHVEQATESMASEPVPNIAKLSTRGAG